MDSVDKSTELPQAIDFGDLVSVITPDLYVFGFCYNAGFVFLFVFGFCDNEGFVFLFVFGFCDNAGFVYLFGFCDKTKHHMFCWYQSILSVVMSVLTRVKYSLACSVGI